MKTNFSIKIKTPEEYNSAMEELIKMGYKEDKDWNLMRLSRWKDKFPLYLDSTDRGKTFSLFSYPDFELEQYESFKHFITQVSN